MRVFPMHSRQSLMLCCYIVEFLQRLCMPCSCLSKNLCLTQAGIKCHEASQVPKAWPEAFQDMLPAGMSVASPQCVWLYERMNRPAELKSVARETMRKHDNMTLIEPGDYEWFDSAQLYFFITLRIYNASTQCFHHSLFDCNP